MEHYVITIARAYGSGGCAIGQELAEELGIRFIDKELLRLASDESGINHELFHRYDENLDAKWHVKKELMTGELLSPSDKRYASRENLYKYQAMVIRKLAERESFVILGRAANYVLRNYPNVLSVNIQAPLEVCVLEAINRLKFPEKKARKYVEETNETRARYYKAVTGKNWLDPDYYDLSLNSARLGKDTCKDLILECLNKKFRLQK